LVEPRIFDALGNVIRSGRVDGIPRIE